MEKKVLIGCPTFNSKKFCIDRFLKNIKYFKYDNFDILFVDNSPDNFHEIIQEAGFKCIKRKSTSTDPMQNIVDNRNIIRDEFLKGNYDNLLFFDSDVLAPPSTIKRLAKHDKPIIGGVYIGGAHIGSEMKLAPLAYQFVDEEKELVTRMPINAFYQENIIEVAALGFGCVMIQREVLENLNISFNKEKGSTEDSDFCRRARALGYKSYIDPYIKCIHMDKKGDFMFPRKV